MSKHKYDDEFRKQIVDLVESKIKTVKEIAGEYSLPVQTIHSWVRKYKNSSSFRDEDQLTPEQKEISELKKRIKQIEEENDLILNDLGYYSTKFFKDLIEKKAYFISKLKLFSSNTIF